MKFLLDNNLPPRLAKALDALCDGTEHHVHALRELYPASTPDEEWLRLFAEDGGGAAVSGDLHIYTTKHQREAWRQSGLTLFFLQPAWSKVRFWEKAAALVRWWPDFLQQVETVAPGVGYEVPFGKRHLKLLRP